MNDLERCRSGRSGRSRKPLFPYGNPGFESLSFRKQTAASQRLAAVFCRKTEAWTRGFVRVSRYFRLVNRRTNRIMHLTMGGKTKRAKLSEPEMVGSLGRSVSYALFGWKRSAKRKVHLLGFCLDSEGGWWTEIWMLVGLDCGRACGAAFIYATMVVWACFVACGGVYLVRL